MSKKEENKVKEEELEKETVQEETTVEEQATVEENPLEKEVEELKKQLQAKDELLKRTAAEYDNYRKRTAKEIGLIATDVKVDTLKNLLPIIDNVERALQYKDSSNSDDIAKGIELIKNQTMEIFAKLGVETIEEENVEFNPELHNAVMHIEDESKDENSVAQMLQKGYKIGDKVLRHAMVSVAN